MEYYAGIDVSLKESSVCVVDTAGKVVREVKVASEPEALVRYFDELGLPVSCIGLEAGPLSQWLHAGLMPPDAMLCCWRRGMSKRRCPP
jgi:transposase